MLALPRGAPDRLRQENGIYLTPDGRINVAGLRSDAIEYVASSIANVIDKA